VSFRTRVERANHSATTEIRSDLISVQPPRSTHSSSVITFSRPPAISSLKTTDHSFRYASPRLWNQLPDSFHQPLQSCLDSLPHSLVSSFIHSFITYLLHNRHTHHHHSHPSLLHSFTPGSKPTLSTNPSYLNISTLDCLHNYRS